MIFVTELEMILLIRFKLKDHFLIFVKISWLNMSFGHWFEQLCTGDLKYTVDLNYY